MENIQFGETNEFLEKFGDNAKVITIANIKREDITTIIQCNKKTRKAALLALIAEILIFMVVIICSFITAISCVFFSQSVFNYFVNITLAAFCIVMLAKSSRSICRYIRDIRETGHDNIIWKHILLLMDEIDLESEAKDVHA